MTGGLIVVVPLSLMTLMRFEQTIRFTLLMLAFTAPCLGQQSRPIGSPQVMEAGNCEIDAANFDSIRLDARSGVGEDEWLIVVARLGSGDTRANLNSHRLYAVKEHLSKSERGIPAGKIVLAEGEKVSGNGKVEFYIDGKLTHVITTIKNQGICIECCNPDPRDFTRVRKKKRKG